MLRMQLEIAEREANKLKEVELSLFKTLKIAEDASQSITSQANLTAEKHVEEAKSESEKVLAEAEIRAKAIMREAEERASYIKEDVLGEVRGLQNEFTNLENRKNNLISQLRELTTGTIAQVSAFEEKFTSDVISQKIQEAERVYDIEKPSPVAEEQVVATETAEMSLVEKVAAEQAIADSPIEEIAQTPTNEPSAATEATEEIVDAIADTKPNADDMLNRVNKVKEAIKKAMQDKTDLTGTKTEGGSFFDEI
jgi:cell division initiation protein